MDTRDPSTQEAKTKDFGFEPSSGHIKRYRLIKVLPKDILIDAQCRDLGLSLAFHMLGNVRFCWLLFLVRMILARITFPMLSLPLKKIL